MPTSILLVLAAVTGTYVLQMGTAALGLALVRRQDPPAPPSTWPSVTVIVPARNEADGIAACLESLRACDYPADRYEIIVVNDGSTDGTAPRVRAHQTTSASTEPAEAHVRLVATAEASACGARHKPHAVKQGIDAATGEIILTTDADCTVEPGWVKSMVRRCTPGTPFVAGPVVYEHEDLFLPRLQALKLLGLVAYGAGTLGLGTPTFCNSANVAYRRDAIPASETSPNGAAQDELLLQHVAYATDREVAFNPDVEAIVTSQPAPSFVAYLQQQARWSQMGLRYPFWFPRLLVIGLWLTHTVLFLCGAVALAVPAWRQPALGALLIKMAIDAVLTVPHARHVGQRGLLRSAVPTELMLVLVVPLVGLFGSFGSPKWKGRELN